MTSETAMREDIRDDGGSSGYPCLRALGIPFSGVENVVALTSPIRSIVQINWKEKSSLLSSL